MDHDAPRTSGAPGWVPADVVRLAGVVSLAVAVIGFDGVAVALMLLVLGGLMVPRALGTVGPVDVAYGTGLLVAAWSGVLGVYRTIPWWDLVVHTAVTGLVSAVAYLVAVRLGLTRDPLHALSAAHRWGVAVLTTALGLGLSVLWEIGEWLGHTYVDPSIHVDQVDTLGDLTAGGVGALAAGRLLVAVAQRVATDDARPARPAPARTHGR